MLAIVTLVCLLGVATASSSDTDSSTSGLLERVAAGKKLVFDLNDDRTVTSSDEDDDDTFTSALSSSSLEEARVAAREQQKIDRALRKAAGFAKSQRERGKRESYQAVMDCAECEDDNVALGPVVFIAKSTTGQVQDDHFDQNPTGPNGVDDVADELNGWATTTNANNRDNALENFLIQVRNRATVNGGSIGLQALVLTGKVKANQNRDAPDTNADATFGGSAQRLLISPCMPVIDDRAFFPSNEFNIQLFGEVVNQPNLFSVDTTGNRIDLDAFLDSNGDFVAVTSTFELALFADPNVVSEPANDVDDASDLLPDTFGSIKFERCSQFSYFM